MHIWTIEKWKKYFDVSDPEHKTGILLRCDKDINPEVRRACKEFAAWMRKEYFFPVRVHVYLKSTTTVRASDGEHVSALCYTPDDREQEPYCRIRVAVGDYGYLRETRSQDDALAAILCSIIHEITHYFQWVNDLTLTLIGEERQARKYAKYVLYEYAETREHP